MKNKLQTILHELWLFVRSRIFWKNFALIILLVTGLLGLTYFSTFLFTRHGHSVETPQLEGMTLPEAKAKYGRSFSFKVDSVSEKDTMTGIAYPPLTILSQNPPRRSKIKKGRTIYLAVQQFSSQLTPIPRIWDRQVELAMSMLGRKNINTVIWKRVNDKAFNTVLKVYYVNASKDTVEIPSYRVGDNAPRIPEGTKLYLVVAKGMGEEVLLPNCRCKPFEMARFLVEGSDLVIGNLMVDGNVTDTALAYVYRQVPTYIDSMKIKKGDEISLWLSNELPAGCDDNLNDPPIDNNNSGDAIDSSRIDDLDMDVSNGSTDRSGEPKREKLRVRTGNYK